MKFTKFQELWSVVNEFKLDRISKTEVKIFYELGLDTDLSDIFTLDNDSLITVLVDGRVIKTIVYISEVSENYIEKWSFPKFHIFNCKTLIRMKEEGRLYRYKKTLRSDGKFFMLVSNSYGNSKQVFEELEICGNCLNLYNKAYNKNYSKRTFLIENFIKEPIISTDSLDSFEFKDDFETLPRFYTKSWKEISLKLKKEKNYTCEKCGINLRKASKYLHTHHSDANPLNNMISNLKVLCIECHSNEFNHSHIKESLDYQKFLDYKKGII